MAKVNLTSATKVDEYNILLDRGQIMVYNGEELVKVFDIKNLNDEKTEFNAFVEKFKKANEARKAKRGIK